MYQTLIRLLSPHTKPKQHMTKNIALSDFLVGHVDSATKGTCEEGSPLPLSCVPPASIIDAAIPPLHKYNLLTLNYSWFLADVKCQFPRADSGYI